MMRYTPLKNMPSVAVTQAFTEKKKVHQVEQIVTGFFYSIYPCVLGLGYGKYLIKNKFWK